MPLKWSILQSRVAAGSYMLSGKQGTIGMSVSPSQRHLNAEEKRSLRAEEIRRFAKQYARPAQKGIEPNDRRFSRDVEKVITRMKPEEFDRLLNGVEE